MSDDELNEQNLEIVYPWDKLVEETPVQYTGFKSYLYCDRDSLDQAYREYYAKRFPDRWEKVVFSNSQMDIVASGTFREWAKVFNWRDRRAAYYEYLHDEIHAEFTQQRLIAMRETIELGRNMRRLATDALSLVTTDNVYKAEAEDGREVWVLKSNIGVGDIMQLAAAGVKLERLIFGDPTDIIQQQVAAVDDNPIDKFQTLLGNIKAKRKLDDSEVE